MAIDDDEFCTLCGELWGKCVCEDLEADEEFYENYEPLVD